METGEELGVNQPGEIYIKGPCVMKGYYNNPTATAGEYTPLSFGGVKFLTFHHCLFITSCEIWFNTY